MPQPGLTYSDTVMDYSFDEVKCPVCGNIPSNFNAAVFVDVNVFMWVSKKKILGANYALVAGLPLSNSALSLAGLGTIAGGGGFYCAANNGSKRIPGRQEEFRSNRQP
jgi:hypothetical protein